MTPPAFHDTRWTLVSKAGLRTEEGRTALSELCGIYYQPVFQFIQVRMAHEDQARELTHAFFAKLLERETLGTPDPEKGKFRSFLLGAVKHFLQSHRAQEQTLKRGGGVEHVAWDESVDVPREEDTHARFDREWALALIKRALNSLEEEMIASGKGEQFAVLQPWLDGGAMGVPRDAATELGLSENAFHVTVHRLRLRFRKLIRTEVEATTATPSEADEEFRHLVEVLSG